MCFALLPFVCLHHSYSQTCQPILMKLRMKNERGYLGESLNYKITCNDFIFFFCFKMVTVYLKVVTEVFELLFSFVQENGRNHQNVTLKLRNTKPHDISKIVLVSDIFSVNSTIKPWNWWARNWQLDIALRNTLWARCYVHGTTSNDFDVRQVNYCFWRGGWTRTGLKAGSATGKASSPCLT